MRTEDAALSAMRTEDAALSAMRTEDAALSAMRTEDAALSTMRTEDAALSTMRTEDDVLFAFAVDASASRTSWGRVITLPFSAQVFWPFDSCTNMRTRLSAATVAGVWPSPLQSSMSLMTPAPPAAIAAHIFSTRVWTGSSSSIANLVAF
jgi:hypothetical protein